MRWFNIQRQGNAAKFHIFGEIMDGDPLSELSGCDDIELFINCTGGDSMKAVDIYNALRGRVSKATIIRASSSAVIIALAATHIAIASDAALMVHSPCSHVVGNPDELRRAAAELEPVVDTWREILCQRTGQPVAIVDTWLRGDTWFSPTEALRFRLVTEIFEATATLKEKVPEVSAGPVQTDEERLFFDLLFAFDRLPVGDKKNFCRELNCWLVRNVQTL